MLETSAARQWKQDVLEAAESKFERRLIEVDAGLRLEISAVRLETAAVRLDIVKAHASMLRWMFGAWLTTMLAIVALATRR